MPKQKTYIVLAIIVLMLTVLSIDTYAQVVHFPDPHLRAAVAEAIDADPDRITVVALRRLTRLDAVYSEIESLEGLQHAPNLRLLDLWNNRISDLNPLANLTNLVELLLVKNQISDLTSLANLTNLEVLLLKENRISDLTPLTSFRNLKALRLGENALIDISPLSGLTNLQTLGIPSNRISDLKPLANLTNLEVLWLGENRISELKPLANLHNLEELVMDRNDITDISSLGRLTNLRILKMTDNGISDLTPLANLTNLEELLLKENRISGISSLANLTRLTRLELSSNNITDVTPLANLTNLKHLELQNNRITDITPLENLTNLEHLDTQNNPIFDADSPIVHIPDPNLRTAIREALKLPDGVPVNRAFMRQLTGLASVSSGISDLTGLEHATSLTRLVLHVNEISDVRPLAPLVKLTHIRMHNNQIEDVSPLANLTMLDTLLLGSNKIVDISPLGNLIRLTTLMLDRNKIVDISALGNLVNLDDVSLVNNRIVDHSPVLQLSIANLEYDQECDMPLLPLLPRLENRNFPSIVAAFGSPTDHDLYFCCLMFGQRFFNMGSGWEVRGDYNTALRARDSYLARNPNMVFIAEVRFFNERGGYPAPDSPDWVWVQDSQGNAVYDGPRRLINFTHPQVQEMIVDQAIAVSKCGLYDGVFLDHWKEDVPPDELHARETIIRRIRDAVRPDFLILVNTNDKIIPRTAPYVNGAFMESFFPHGHVGDELEARVTKGENVLHWMESNLQPPIINALAGGSNIEEPPDSPYNLRWMRAVTTLSLTHSDGYVTFNIGTRESHRIWYDFWDADLGRPVDEKGQLYQETDGLYIREFTNGWAVYNHSGAPQIITLPEEVQGFASELVNTEHALPNLDGEMYLRVPPVNPADVNGDGVVNVFDLVFVANQF